MQQEMAALAQMAPLPDEIAPLPDESSAQSQDERQDDEGAGYAFLCLLFLFLASKEGRESSKLPG